jgi:hypothetical protein
MDEMKYALLTEVLGRWKADVIENFLESEGMDVVVVQETVSDLFTSTFSPVKIYVPKESITRSRELLKAFDESQDETEEQ